MVFTISSWGKFHKPFTGNFCTSRFTPILLTHTVKQTAQKLSVNLVECTDKVGRETEWCQRMHTGAFALCTIRLVKSTPGFRLWIWIYLNRSVLLEKFHFLFQGSNVPDLNCSVSKSANDRVSPEKYHLQYSSCFNCQLVQRFLPLVQRNTGLVER